jgi:hypothetical protein
MDSVRYLLGWALIVIGIGTFVGGLLINNGSVGLTGLTIILIGYLTGNFYRNGGEGQNFSRLEDED